MLNTSLIKTHDVIPQVCPTRCSHDLDSSQVLAELNADLAHLQGQLSCWHHYHGWKETHTIRADINAEKIKVSSSRKTIDGVVQCSDHNQYIINIFHQFQSNKRTTDQSVHVCSLSTTSLQFMKLSLLFSHGCHIFMLMSQFILLHFTQFSVVCSAADH